MLDYRIKNIGEVSDIETKWGVVVNETSYAWFWSEYYEHCFRIAVLKANGRFVKDESFLVYSGDQLCGLTPLVIINSCEFDGIEAGYDKPLPCPMVIDSFQDKEGVVKFIFDKINEKVEHNKVEKISIQHSPPGLQGNLNEYFLSIIKEYKYLNISHMSHYVDIYSEVLTNIRKRYKRYVKKYSSLYEIRIIDKDNFNIELPKIYMDLHIKDSGCFNRPLETYISQFDYVVKGNGFIVQAINKGANINAGMLLISMSKNSAYDASVAVDPRFQQEFVSHIMKWKAIQYMVDTGVDCYELGRVAKDNSYLDQPSEKNYSISFFKDGWSRGGSREVHTYERYFSKIALSKAWGSRLTKLINYYDI